MARMIQLTCEQCGIQYEKIAHECRKDRRFCSTKCQYDARKVLQVGRTKCCTKCKRELTLDKFWKTDKRASGYYPSCMECEKSDRLKHMQNNPMCCRCWITPHTPKSLHCYDCQRIVSNRGPRKWISRRTGLEWCKICEQRPSEENHQYCTLCRKEYTSRTREKKWAKRYHTAPMRQKQTARAYATGLLARGKIKRGLCVFCGCKGTEFHHYDYLPKTMNFEDVCEMCHEDVHRVLKILLTLHTCEVIGFPIAEVRF